MKPLSDSGFPAWVSRNVFSKFSHGVFHKGNKNLIAHYL